MKRSGPLGRYPDVWPIRRLGEVTLKIGSGATPTGGEKAYLPARERFALIRSQSVHDRRFDLSSLSFISHRQARDLRNAEVRTGDVLLNITGDGTTFARSTLVPEEALPACVNQHVAIIRANPALLCPGYLLAYLTHPLAKAYIEGFNSGGSRRAVTKGHIESFEIPLPPIEEQEAIAEALAALDDKIELNRRMNETLEAMAQAIFRDWFVDFGPVRRKLAGITDPVEIMGGLARHPDRAAELSALFPSGVDGEGTPEGWRVSNLGALAEAAGEGVAPSAIRPETPYIGLEHMPRRSIALDTWETAAKVSSQKARFRRGQILFGKLRPYFHKVGIAPIDGVCSTDIVVLDSRTGFDRPLVASCVSSDAFVAFTDQASTGTKMPRTSWAQMRDYSLTVAAEPVRKAFAQIVGPMHDKIVSAISESRTLAEARDYLLPRLMSGEVRADRATEEIAA